MTRTTTDPTTFARDALDGFAAANARHVRRTADGVIRRSPVEGHVAVVIGGGSGHYPAFAGVVGEGLATAAACGNVFASPSAAQIHRIAAETNSGGGVLLAYGNYAGDVLNFTDAQERLERDGIPTRSIAVTDDIASASVAEKRKRRGVAGDLAVFKVAGAAAERGDDLETVERIARKANERTASLGVAFGAPTLPGSQLPLFAVPAGSMSLGLGIHGEPGIRDVPVPSAAELAELLVTSLLDERPAGQSRVVVLLNGLGTVKYEELFVLYSKITPLLLAAGLQIVDAQVGELVTSLDMPGLSLTLFWVDDELEQLWLAPAASASFHMGRAAGTPEQALPAAVSTAAHSVEAPTADATTASKDAAQFAARLFALVHEITVENETMFGLIDAIAGDGDHGTGMRRGAEAAAASARESAAKGWGLAQLVASAGDAWADRAGGTSGALWGAGLARLATTFGTVESFDTRDAARGAAAALHEIQDRGGAQVGDKTLVDALSAFVDSLSACADSGISLAPALRTASSAATTAANETAQLLPRLGRARPLGEKSLGHPDAGATSLALILTAIAKETSL
jgi:dihydroxyacetone kinase